RRDLREEPGRIATSSGPRPTARPAAAGRSRRGDRSGRQLGKPPAGLAAHFSNTKVFETAELAHRVVFKRILFLEVDMSNWWEGRRVTVTGGHGFVGRRVAALLLQKRNVQVMTFSSQDYDLTRQTAVARMYADQRPHTVIHLPARVAALGANR